MLSRALCRFRLFRAPAALTRTQIARAARTFAAAHAPFVDTGSLVLRSPHGAEIWYWDKSELPAGAASGAPESVLRAPGDGWRIVACEEGFEAQYWERGGLLASTWRRQAFTPEQWAAFVMGVEGAERDAPNAPPPPEQVRLQLGARWRGRQIKAPPTWRDGELYALTAGLCAAALTAFFVGQALHADLRARGYAARLAALEQRVASDPRLERVREHMAVLRGYNGVGGGADVLSAAADAFAVFGQFGLEVNSWRIDARSFHATLNASMMDLPLREIVAALEATPLLCGVEPNLSSQQGMVELMASTPSADGSCERADARGRRA